MCRNGRWRDTPWMGPGESRAAAQGPEALAAYRRERDAVLEARDVEWALLMDRYVDDTR